MTNWRKEILTEANRLSESVELSSIQHFIASIWWKMAHFILGISSTVFATVSTTLIFSESALVLAGFLSLLVAIQAALITFLKPKEQAALHQLKGIDYQELQAELRRFSSIIVGVEKQKQSLVKQLDALSNRKFDTDRKQPAVPGGLFYWLAKRSISRGETSFRIDETS